MMSWLIKFNLAYIKNNLFAILVIKKIVYINMLVIIRKVNLEMSTNLARSESCKRKSSLWLPLSISSDKDDELFYFVSYCEKNKLLFLIFGNYSAIF